MPHRTRYRRLSCGYGAHARYQPSGKLLTYLLRVVHNICLDYHRAYRPTSPLVEADRIANAKNDLHVDCQSRALALAVRRAIQDLRDLIRRMMARNLVAVIAQRLLPRADRPGRAAANEALVVTQRTRQLLLEGPTDLTTALMMEASRHVGMQTMEDSLVELYCNNTISYETAWLNITDRDRLGPFARRAEQQ